MVCAGTRRHVQVMADIQELLQREHCQLFLAMRIVWQHILTPLQGAFMAVKLYPTHPSVKPPHLVFSAFHEHIQKHTCYWQKVTELTLGAAFKPMLGTVYLSSFKHVSLEIHSLQ